MQAISLDQGLEIALDALLTDRLALLCGAGLSMAAPTSLPGAAAIASEAKFRHDSTYGVTRPPLPEGIEDQAEYFFQRGELASVYFRSFVDHHGFAGPPNAGHLAVADLLLIRGIQTAVTTNVDCAIEVAGQTLYGQIGTAVDGMNIARLPPDVAPLLKVHGCRQADPENMVWSRGQLAVEPVASRIATSRQWLQLRLMDRDLLIVGYWTDWDYMNAVIRSTTDTTHPRRVIVIDTADAATFQRKAPHLYSLGERATGGFQHVRISGASFLDALRLQFARTFVRRLLHSGATEYTALVGIAPNAAWTEPPPLDNSTLWQMRRDLEGSGPLDPALSRTPANEPLIGLTILQLRARGATSDGSYWLLGDRRVRVVRAANQPLYRVKARYERETPPSTAPHFIIAVGAELDPLPANIARPDSAATIARGTAGMWLTRQAAIQELGL